MIQEKIQKKILKEALQNEVRPSLISLKEVVKESNQILKDIKDKEYPVAEPTDIQPLIKSIETLTEEVKKKSEYTHEIKVDADLKKKLKGARGERGLRGLSIKGKDGKDGKTPVIDIEKIKKQITPIKGKDYFDGGKGEKGTDGNIITATEIRNKLESLTGKQRLSAKAIKGIEDLIKGEVQKSYSGGGHGGGGTGGDTTTSGIKSVVAGTNITVDNTDPNNPIINGSTKYAVSVVKSVNNSVIYHDADDTVPSFLTNRNGDFIMTLKSF